MPSHGFSPHHFKESQGNHTNSKNQNFCSLLFCKHSKYSEHLPRVPTMQKAYAKGCKLAAQRLTFISKCVLFELFSILK